MKGKISKLLLVLIVLFLSTFILTHTLRSSIKKVNTQEILDNMSLEEKIGQLFIFGFWGTEPDYYISRMLNERYIGGVILLSYNIENKDQMKILTDRLQSMSNNPLFISIDQEGGLVSRILFEDFDNTAQYDITTEQQAYDIANKRGKQLKELGINMNFSPVSDYITNEESFLYKRVFRGGKEDIVRLSSSMIQGYEDAGIIPIVKHYPGYNDASSDSHETLPVVDITFDGFDEYIYQFRKILESSNGVLTSHILLPNMDADTPSSVSKVFVNDILREKLSFEGLIITDDMQMKSIYDKYPIKEAAVNAILVGNDILIYTGNPEEQVEAYTAVLEATRNGVIKESYMNEKVLRILNAKYALK